MRRLAILATLLGGCLGPETVECASGGVCPAGTECRMDRGEEVCVPAACGNRIIDPGEDCDDGNTTSGDGCQATCRLTVRPAGREGVALAYHTMNNRLVVVGGRNASVVLDDSWIWDGRDWSELPVISPTMPARYGAAITYDSTRGAILMFGGYGVDDRPLDDFWSLYDTRWYQIGPGGQRPSARAGAAMAFDRRRGVMVMFGGMAATGASNETWEWDGVEWTLRPTTAAPSAREGAAMTYDEARGEVMLVGGINANDNNTWLWNGTRWATIGGLVTPSDLLGARLAFDRERRRPVLYGGVHVPDYNSVGGTWELTSDGWVEKVPVTTPAPRTSFGMAYVEPQQAVMIFGGRHFDLDANPAGLSNDLWSWDGVTWREFQ